MAYARFIAARTDNIIITIIKGIIAAAPDVVVEPYKPDELDTADNIDAEVANKII